MLLLPDRHQFLQHNQATSASYRIHVQSNGNLLIGAAYTKQLGLKPGDELEINLGRKHIHLKQLTQEEDQDKAVA